MGRKDGKMSRNQLQKTTELLRGGGGGGGWRRETWRLKGTDEEIKKRVLSYSPQKIAFNFPS